MKELFSLYLQTGFSGSILIAAVLVARLFLRRAPRRILCLAWLLVVLRLLVPFQIESMFSLQPEPLSFSATVHEETVMPSVSVPNTSLETPDVTLQNGSQDTSLIPESPTVDYFLIVSIIWSIVSCGFILYETISYLRLKAKVRDAIRQPNGTKECANINNAFLIGLFCPVIYLPTNLTSQERELIVLHEKTHIAHGDNWWKLLCFLCLSLHWYNPLVWITFHFFAKDIEIACDEKVVHKLDTANRKAYAMALLSFGKRSRAPYLPSSSFGKVSLKQRLTYIVSYKKPHLWISIVAILLVVVIAVCFLSYPQPTAQNPQQQLQASGTPTETQPQTVPEKPTESTPVTSTEPTIFIEETTAATEPDPTTPPITEPPVTNPPAPPTTKPPAPQVTEPPPPTEQPDPNNSNKHNFDLRMVDANATNYAANLGFQTLDSHPNTNVAKFSTSCDAVSHLTLSQLQDAVYQTVDNAHRYCINNQYPVSSSLLWVNISYDGFWGFYSITVYCAV